MEHASAAIPDLPAMPRDQDGPVFDEPWQAHAFAVAVRLAETGCFSWREWSAALSQQIRLAQEHHGPGVGYYHHWLRALERLCVEKGLVNTPDLQRRKQEWQRAYLNTPHGQPIELSVGDAGL
jgi:nitrile hydratase accessory protein